MLVKNAGRIGVVLLACTLAPLSASAQSSPVSSHFTTSDGVELHYLEAGSGPTLVFVPGWTVPAQIWRAQLDNFGATHRVIALDPRGHGESAKPTEGYHPQRRARDIGELIDHLGGDPAVVVGWSMGAMEILNHVQEFGTETFRAVVLVDNPISLEPELIEQIVSFQVQGVQGDRPEWTRAFIEAQFVTPQSAEYLDELTRATLATPTNAAVVLSANVMLVGPADFSLAMDALDRPLLLVFSSAPWTGAAAEDVRTRWPEAEVQVVEESGHALFVDRPEAFNQILESFLATLPPL